MEKYCKYCGKKLTKKSQKCFCNNKCQKEYNYKKYIDEWKQGKKTGKRGKYQLSHYIIRYLFEKYHGKCAICGWNEINNFTKKSPLEIHHIDGDPDNNNEDNLILICPNCHSLTENYKGANKKVSSRQNRRKYLR